MSSGPLPPGITLVRAPAVAGAGTPRRPLVIGSACWRFDTPTGWHCAPPPERIERAERDAEEMLRALNDREGKMQ